MKKWNHQISYDKSKFFIEISFASERRPVLIGYKTKTMAEYMFNLYSKQKGKVVKYIGNGEELNSIIKNENDGKHSKGDKE